MPEFNWHKGLSGLTNRERIVVLHCEHEARQRAIQSWYDERLTLTSTLVCDAADLDVSSLRVQWARRRGYLYVILTCQNHRADRIRTYRWRLDVPRTAEKSFTALVKKGLRDYG